MSNEFIKRRLVHVELSRVLCLAHDLVQGIKRLVGTVVVVEESQVVVRVLNSVTIQDHLTTVVSAVVEVDGQWTQSIGLTVASLEVVLQLHSLSDKATDDLLVDAKSCEDGAASERDERVSLDQLQDDVDDRVTIDASRHHLDRQSREALVTVNDGSVGVLDVRVEDLPVLVREGVEAKENDSTSDTLTLAVDDSRHDVALDRVHGTLPGLHRGCE